MIDISRNMTQPHHLFLLTAEQMKEADMQAIGRIGDGFPLMQKAGKAVFDHAMHLLEPQALPPKILVLCSVGNNGGDGFIAAKHFLQEDIPVELLLLGDTDKMSATARRAFENIPQSCLVETDSVNWAEATLIIDALFGIGLDRDITGAYAETIEKANRSQALRIAVDIASGIHADSGKVMGTAFHADHTLTFFCAKPGHYLMPGKGYAGQVTIADIGIEPQDCDASKVRYRLNHPDCWQHLLPEATAEQHKYDHGHSIIIGGDASHSGASKLAALAALRAGSGLVSIACDEAALTVYAEWATAVMTKPYQSKEELEAILQHPKVTAIAFGMGAGLGEETRQKVFSLLQTGKPCVLDADAISAFENQFEDLQPHLHKQVALTPHAGEFSRLFGHDTQNEGRLQQALKAASKAGCVVVFKGSDTIIAAPDGHAYINYTAPAHLATAGSGDVLSGIIAGQLAQGIPALEAAASGVWMHSQAANHYGKGMIADDIIEGLLARK